MLYDLYSNYYPKLSHRCKTKSKQDEEKARSVVFNSKEQGEGKHYIK